MGGGGLGPSVFHVDKITFLCYSYPGHQAVGKVSDGCCWLQPFSQGHFSSLSCIKLAEHFP